jgi:hypothetical protein
MPLEIATDYVSLNEPCFNLAEMDKQSAGNKGWHRYRILVVVRGDRLVEHWEDMGETRLFKADQIRILGGTINNGRIQIEHTVGELMDIADKVRETVRWDKCELAGVNSCN